MTIVSIIVATVVTFLFSTFFYAPSVMWHTWQKALWIHTHKEDMTFGKVFKKSALTLLLYFLQFFILAFFIDRLWINSISEAVIITIMMWLFLETSMFARWMNEHKKVQAIHIAALEDFLRLLIGVIIMILMMP